MELQCYAHRILSVEHKPCNGRSRRTISFLVSLVTISCQSDPDTNSCADERTRALFWTGTSSPKLAVDVIVHEFRSGRKSSCRFPAVLVATRASTHWRGSELLMLLCRCVDRVHGNPKRSTHRKNRRSGAAGGSTEALALSHFIGDAQLISRNIRGNLTSNSEERGQCR